MVSKILNKGLLLMAALLVFSACEKPFKLDLPLAVDSHEYKLSAKAGQARIFFYTTMPWSITTDPGECPWAVINEATEKLYERHCLVIKIVSSFFCFSDKIFVSLSVDLQ